MAAGMLLGMIADAERPRATLALLLLPVAVVAGSDDHSASGRDEPSVMKQPARSYWLYRNHHVPEPIGLGPRGIQVGLAGRLFAVLTNHTAHSWPQNSLYLQHHLFEIDDPLAVSRFVHHASLDYFPFCRNDDQDPRCALDHFVAELVIAPHPGNGWMPPYDAEVLRVVAAPDLAAARAMLPVIAARGIPGPDLRCQSILPSECTQ